MDINELIYLAEEGDPESQTDLGICYFRGYGVAPNMEKALFWFLQAANQNEPSALTNAGRCYLFGIGTDKNVKTAIQLLTKACEFNIPEAQTALGIIYMYGDGMPANPNRAFELFTCASRKESPEVLNCLGRSYLEGIGTEKDLSKAISYFYKERVYGGFGENDFRYIFSKINIDELIMLADGGSAEAQCFLAGMYIDGIGIEEDIDKGWELLCKASSQNNPLALFIRGTMYYNAANYILAEMMFEEAVAKGWNEAQKYLEMTRDKLTEMGSYFLVKIADKQWADKFRSGELFMRSVGGFSDSNMNTARHDSEEGVVSRRTPEFQMGASGANMGNRKIFCLYSLDFDTKYGYLSPPNQKLLDKSEAFGDTAVLILNGNEFIRRVKQAFEERYDRNFSISYKRVSYDMDTFYKSESSYNDEFHKVSSYGWQREFRISLDISNGRLPLKYKTDKMLSQGCGFDDDPASDFNADCIIVDIGCIEKITMEIPIEDFVAKIDKLIDAKYVPPEKMETYFDSRTYTEGLLPRFYNSKPFNTAWSENPLKNPRSQIKKLEVTKAFDLLDRSIDEITENIKKNIEREKKRQSCE